jgi:membrane-associated protease RseP (regulator of RpoE activity)
MRKSILMALLLGSVLVASAAAVEESSARPVVESFGYSSDDYGTGSYLGVDINDVTSERLGALKLKEEHGVEVMIVDQDSPAGKAGLKEHDVILNLNGTTIESGAQLRRLIRETPPGRSVTLGISRDGQPVTLKVQLTDRKQAFAMAKPGQVWKMEMPVFPAIPEFDLPVSVVVVHSAARSGLMVENLTPQLGDFFGAKNGQGVLVRSVEKGSRAESAGLRAGDVIIKVDGERIGDANDFSRAMRVRKGNTVSVGIIRDRKEQNINLTLPERKQSGEMLQESLEAPELDADVEVDLADLDSELAQLAPQMELAIDQAVSQAGRALDEAGKSLCSQQEALKGHHTREQRKQQVEARKQLREQQREMRQQQLEMKKQLDEQQRELQEEIRIQVVRPEGDLI